MRIRQIFAAALLAATTVGAMSHETDLNQTPATVSTAATESPAGQKDNAIKGTAAAPAQAVPMNRVSAPAHTASPGLTRAQVRAELLQWRLAHNGAPVGQIY